jgi:hypothetical protein
MTQVVMPVRLKLSVNGKVAGSSWQAEKLVNLNRR